MLHPKTHFEQVPLKIVVQKIMQGQIRRGKAIEPGPAQKNAERPAAHVYAKGDRVNP
jgi:hypothetical protein